MKLRYLLAALLLLPAQSFAATDTKISALTNGNACLSTDDIPAVRSGANVRCQQSAFTILDANFTLQDDVDHTKQAQFQLSGISTATTITLTVPNISGTLAMTTGSQTLSNKTLSSSTINFTNTVDMTDGATAVVNTADNTKKMLWDLSQITTSTTRTYIWPDANTTLVGTTNTQTLTNKTISGASNTISGPIVGTTTNDNACSGCVGEYISNGASGSFANVTITIASPAVITYTAHGFSANSPISFTTTGALPTGLTAGTNYYIVGSSITANTFEVATSISNATAGIAVNTSGTQSGTQTAKNAANLTSGATSDVLGIVLSAGDWEVVGNITIFSPTGTTTGSQYAGTTNTVSNTLGSSAFGGYTVLSIANSAGAANESFPLGLKRYEVANASTQIVYLNAQCTFGASTMNAIGFIGAIRLR
jgi:hypothetical protein